MRIPTILPHPHEFDEEAEGIPVPHGRRLELPGRGTTFVREVDGPPGAPTVVLLHGWIASGGINWYQTFRPLSRHYRVLAPDMRGHGRGIRSYRRFRLADVADDTAALLDVLGVEKAIFVGYSLGGPVAQLMWRQHRDRMAGLVLCATSHDFIPGMRARMVFTSTMAAVAGTSRVGQLASVLPNQVAKTMVPVRVKGRPDTLQRWAAQEMQRHDWRMVLEAGQAIGHYNASRWIGKVDVPTAVVVTTRDRAVTPAQQAKMAFAIPGASIHRCEDGHTACTNNTLTGPLLEALHAVSARAYPETHGLVAVPPA
ncbi:MAG: alpha/beta hydrolase [Acidimicrobiales bacterium]|jgi:pimeloyl-ACP methyl ester carboxylesterase|nr:alpha/beta hydrolase [Acidimicrobiales bacterium]